MHPQHIVAAGCLVTNEAGLILLVRSPKRGWEFPGGQVEEGESIDAAVIREVHEETGLRCAVDKTGFSYHIPFETTKGDF